MCPRRLLFNRLFNRCATGPTRALLAGPGLDAETEDAHKTLGVLMATINQSILLIALPDIFDGIKINPLVPANTGYLLWILMGYMVVMAVLVVSLGRIGDMYGRTRMYNLGFVIFTVFSLLLAVTWLQGTAAAFWLISRDIGVVHRFGHGRDPRPDQLAPGFHRLGAVWFVRDDLGLLKAP